MELVLSLVSKGKVKVICDGQESHTFELMNIFPEKQGRQESITLLNDPVETGRRFFNALFQSGTISLHALDASPKRILLVINNKELDAIPWEYLYGPNGYLVLDFDFVRGLPESQRQLTPDLQNTSLHIIAVPSNPISNYVSPLDIDGEWQRLKEGVQGLGSAIILERVRPPTLDQTRRLVANQKNRVLHFMGHGGNTEEKSLILFEDERGGPREVTAQEFLRILDGTTFLVILNSCEGAALEQTEFSNIAQALVQRKVPYAIGMRFAIPDEDAKGFSRAFYDELTRGMSVESGLRHARHILAESKNPWAIGIPVLYTSLREPAGGFMQQAGRPQVDEHQPPIEVFILPKAKGAFQGRIDELLALGKALTSEPRTKLLTIHGAGGQGKTALVREAAERFAYAWPGGIFAISLETKPTRTTFCFQLSQFLKLPTDQLSQPAELEHAILTRLHQQRTLLVLDNAETFTEAVRANDHDALDLADFLRERLLDTPSSMLVTSREPLGWPGEQVLLLEGLSPREGAALFLQSAHQRQNEIQMEQAEALSIRLDGHPLALLLLGLAFNEIAISLKQFTAEHETRLLQAADHYKAVDHRHRTLYASIETSVRHLDEAHRSTLSGLWIFQAPFLPETAVKLFTPAGLSEEESRSRQEQITDQLYNLFRRGLLVREVETLFEGNLVLYRTLPTVRLFAQHYMEQGSTVESLQSRLGSIHAELVQSIDRQLDRSSWASYMAIRSRVDLEESLLWVAEGERGWYADHLGWVLQRIGDPRAGLHYLEKALEMAQGRDQQLELHVINNMALIYRATGQPVKALELFEQALPIRREMGDRAGEAATLNNMALVYRATGQPVKALELFEQALPIRREMGDRAGEAATLNNMAVVYSVTGRPDNALELFDQALPIRRAVGDRAGEAATLNNMAAVYRDTGQLDKALALYEQALPIRRAVGDRAGEAATLNNMATVFQSMGQLDKALALYEQALPIMRAVGDRAGEATTLNNLAAVYRNTGKLGKVLELYEQALPIMRAVGDRAGEAATLNNMAGVYQAMRQPDRALALYEQALPIMRAVGDRAGEATALNNVAAVYRSMGKLGKALELYEQALPIRRDVGDRTGEAVTCFNIAMLSRDLGQPRRAVELLRRAVLLENQIQHPDYPQDVAMLARWEAALSKDEPLPGEYAGTAAKGLSPQQVQIISDNTLAVLTDMPEKHSEWREVIAAALIQSQTANLEADTEFITAILALLDGKSPTIPADISYAGVIQTISERLARLQSAQTVQVDPALPSNLPTDFVARCVAGLKGSPQDKEALFDYLIDVNKRLTVPEAEQLVRNVQLVLLGRDPTTLRSELPEPYVAIWQKILSHSDL